MHNKINMWIYYLSQCNGCDVIGSRDKFRPYWEIIEGSIPSDHILYYNKYMINEFFLVSENYSDTNNYHIIKISKKFICYFIINSELIN